MPSFATGYAISQAMKQSHQCPKCNGKELLVIQPFRIPSERMSGDPMPVVVHQEPENKSRWSVDMSVRPIGSIDLFLCSTCGYSEMWARNFADVRPTADGSIKKLSIATPAQGPFR
jgi:predicted nucleic-acid-binding Zn-ribbon protein